MTDQSPYIMSPSLYHSLTRVKGFREHNGDTYPKYIIMRLTENVILSNQIKHKKVIKTLLRHVKTDEKAIKTLGEFGIKYTHIYD